MSCYLRIMAFWFYVALGSKLSKKHVSNSIMPPCDTEPAYNISFWVRQLHLQQCVIVEIGDKFCGLFIEYRPPEAGPSSEVEEYFLGLCDLATLRKWKFCPTAVETERPKECVFQEHSLAFYGEPCNCSSTIFHGQKLHEVSGFPTCFLPPLPQSICFPGNVCGVSNCKATTVNKIHTVKCSPLCLGRQPFCERSDLDTSQASDIYSYWTDWSNPECSEFSNCTDGTLQSQALCINKNTGMGAMDCLGPGTNCCPPDAEKCKCYIYMEDGVLKLTRELKLKSSYYYQAKRDLSSQFKGKVSKRPRTYINKRNNPKPFRKFDYEEDDEEAEDSNDDDIVLEEDNYDVVKVTTTEKSERNEIVLGQHIPDASNKTILIDEMAKDTNQTEPDNSSGEMQVNIITFSFIVILWIYICLLYSFSYDKFLI